LPDDILVNVALFARRVSSMVEYSVKTRIGSQQQLYEGIKREFDT
jgi:hypothetical protein